MMDYMQTVEVAVVRAVAGRRVLAELAAAVMEVSTLVQSGQTVA